MVSVAESSDSPLFQASVCCQEAKYYIGLTLVTKDIRVRPETAILLL